MAFLSRFSRNGTRSPSRGSREERNNHPILSVFELERLLYTGKTACNHADEVWPGLYLGDQYVSEGDRNCGAEGYLKCRGLGEESWKREGEEDTMGRRRRKDVSTAVLRDWRAAGGGGWRWHAQGVCDIDLKFWSLSLASFLSL